MTRRAISLASISVALVLVLGACGGGGPTKTDAASTSTSTTTNAPKFSGKGSGDFCRFARDVEKNSSHATDLTSKQGFDDLNKLMDQAIASAPSEIKGDFKTLGKAYDGLRVVYARYGYDQTKIAAAMQKDPTLAKELSGLMSSADLEGAGTRITAYMAKVCGINDTTTSTSG